jgi:orotidine-5'-phosphate decarboxylase
MDRTPPLVVALDFPDKGPALALAGRLLGKVAWVKVGLELFIAAPEVIPALRDMGHEVFADLKLHDIPNTVAGAVTSAGRSGASLLTVHASGGPAMLRAAVEAAEAAGSDDRAGATWAPGARKRLRLIGVTVLTSLDQSALAGVGVAGCLDDQVARLAALAAAAGLEGVVASAWEATRLRAAHSPPFLVVTPGVRPTWDAGSQDQARVRTPRQAILAGADLVVVGRPITAAKDPMAAAERIGEELLGALDELERSG